MTRTPGSSSVLSKPGRSLTLTGHQHLLSTSKAQLDAVPFSVALCNADAPVSPDLDEVKGFRARADIHSSAHSSASGSKDTTVWQEIPLDARLSRLRATVGGMMDRHLPTPRLMAGSNFL
jgi:hypothetical protein